MFEFEKMLHYLILTPELVFRAKLLKLVIELWMDLALEF
jgi:hypothetical protein